jgi:hypothetical protein
LSPWRQLLHRTVDGLARLRSAGQFAPDWVLGGGTALMIHAGHRISKDIDAFIDDPQYLASLSPRLAGDGIWACKAYEESANHLRLVFPEGEVDFIVAAKTTDLENEFRTIDVSEIAAGVAHTIEVEHPVETAIKKLTYRGSMLKVRDVLDIAVVDPLFAEVLRTNLHHVARLKPAILGRLNGISVDYLPLEIDELDITADWRSRALLCRDRVCEIIAAISD